MAYDRRTAARQWQPEDGWKSRTHKILFLVCAACLSLYLSFVTFLSGSALFEGKLETAFALVWFLAYAALWFLGLCWLCGRARQGLPWITAKKSKLSPMLFGISMGLSLLVLGCLFLAYYPGGVSYDIYNQWTQAQTGLYNHWHPVFHTLLMWLGLQVMNQYPWLVLLQMVFFSAAMAYLVCTLAAHGLPRGLLLALQGLMVLSSILGNAMMYVWKDNAMTMGALLLCAYGVNVYVSRGDWLKKWPHAVALGLVLAFTTLVRHNAAFFTAPLLLCLLLGYWRQRKGLLLATGVAGLCLLLVMGPLYGALDIVSPGNTYEESIGIPMTVLFDARVKSPEAMDAETQAFLTSLADEETLQANYRLGDYNSIKFQYPREQITSVPPEKLLGMAVRTAARAPRTAFEAVCGLTDLVWDVTGQNEGTVTVRNTGDIEAFPAQDARMNQLGRTLVGVLEAPMRFAPLRWLFENIGVQMALLLVCGLWALHREGPQALLFCLPVLLYNLGTMLLLCGNDVRFFQFSMAVSLPSMLVLCQGRRKGAAS